MTWLCLKMVDKNLILPGIAETQAAFYSYIHASRRFFALAREISCRDSEVRGKATEKATGFYSYIHASGQIFALSEQIGGVFVNSVAERATGFLLLYTHKRAIFCIGKGHCLLRIPSFGGKRQESIRAFYSYIHASGQIFALAVGRKVSEAGGRNFREGFSLIIIRKRANFCIGKGG